MKIIITVIALFAVTISAQSQITSNRTIDSLQNLLAVAKADTEKINIINDIGKENRIIGNNDEAIKYAELALKKSRLIGYKTGEASAYNFLGIAYTIATDYTKAIENYSLAISVCEKTTDRKIIIKIYNNIGITYGRMGDDEKQIHSYMQSLKMSEESNDTASIAIIYQNIGSVYMENDNDKALDYFFKSLELFVKIKDENGEGDSYTNIAFVYINKEDYKKALEFAEKSLMINKKNNNKWQLSSSITCIADIYLKTGNYIEALKNRMLALNICQEMGDESGISNNYTEIGNIYLKINDLNKSFKYLSLSIIASKKIDNKSNLSESYRLMSELFNKRNNCRKSYDYYLLYSNLKETINSTDGASMIENLQIKYESDKREKILALEQQAKDEKQKAKFEKERIIRYSFMAGFILILAVAFFIFKGYRDKVKSNKTISEQKKLVEEKNHEIADSIKYASRVQQAILPPDDFVNEIMPEHFIYFSPKDVISGDFYFVDKEGDKLFWASCDATGHGASGALLSMLGSNILSGIIKDGETVPSRILDKLNERINQSLHKTSDESIRDGMDVSFCCLDTTLNKLHWAGANNPLWIIRGTEILEYKADKLAIGQMYKDANYTNHEIQLQAGDTIVSFSDGFCDQFNADGKKFMKKRFRELLLSMTEKSMSAQKTIITNTINEWMSGGTVEQTDDLLVFAVRI